MKLEIWSKHQNNLVDFGTQTPEYVKILAVIFIRNET